MYVDIHCHMDDPVFAENTHEVLQRAAAVGVKAIISNGLGGESNKKVRLLAERYPLIRPAYGMYPSETLHDDQEIAWIRHEALGKYPPVAIGEIGLDGVEPVSDAQRSRFQKACALATELRIPIIVHSRKAEQDVYDELHAMQFPGFVVMHCFSGSKKLILEGVKRKYFFSVPATIGRATHFQMLVELVPISQLLTETDSPYLFPQTFPNEPANVVQTVEHIARIKKITAEECKNLLFMNYQRVFSGR